MHVTVTGGAGFIASHLVDALIQRGDTVTVIDDMSNGYEANKNPKATYLNLDIASSILSNHIKSSEIIYHLACAPRSHSFKDPMQDLLTNYYSTLRLCEWAKFSKAHIVFSSNSGLIGEPEYLPIDEKHPPNPYTPYDVHKLASEYLLQLYSRTYDFPVTIYRFAAVYGPRQRCKPDWKPIIPEWITRMLKDKPITIEGSGEQTRDFVYVSDVVSALLKAREGKVGPYLVASGQETSINDLASTLFKMIHSESNIIKAPAKPGDIKRMSYNLHKIRTELNWKPTVPLWEGLLKTLEWGKTQ